MKRKREKKKADDRKSEVEGKKIKRKRNLE